ncbi:Virus X resistance protein-like, coiled-coil domain [Sesbania bispinosa]|nr:Virus X resistance protein-like, coiled-coil domain [Sesbania bispinosa]
MAQSFVFDVAHSLLGKLSSYAYEEASRAYGVYDDLQGIKDTLSIVKGVLLDAELKKDQRHALREWLRQIQHVCSYAEDVLDGFQCQNSRNHLVKASGSTSMKVGHFFSSSNPVVFRLRMAHQIRDVRDRLDKVAADGTRFGLERIDIDPGLGVQRREMSHSHVDASDVIGRENDKEKIVMFLMQPQPDSDQSPRVIPIVGIGGLGKTTLAKLVFNDKRMNELFQLKMWVCVSYDFDIRQIIIKIINSASASNIAIVPQENISHLDIEQLQLRLRYKLSGQKFLLVLDDIWNADRAKWIELKDLIKVGAKGSKILVTTRRRRRKKYPNLVEMGKEIVKKCHGVPLAVRTLGSSLYSKFDLDRWEFVRDHEIWNLNQKENDILPALKLSYDQMPSYLRHCFAYFSLFPKDYRFSNIIPTNLWLASGSLQSPDGSQTLDNVARECIEELRSRSFLQDFEDYGPLYFFKVHDLVHDLALYVAKEEFLVVDSNTRNIPEQVRHLSLIETDSLGHALFPKSKSVRTILLPINGVGLDSETLLDTWMSRYKYLRYLDLSDSSFETLPNSIAKLEHLRVLYLSNNRKIKRLSRSICKLQNLQLLSLKGCIELETLPKGFGNLISLRHLSITTKQFLLSENEFASLSNLQTLGFFYCDNLKFLFSKAQLTSLEELVVLSCGSLESLPFYILPKLQTLSVIDCKVLNLSLNQERPITDYERPKLSMNDDSPSKNFQMVQKSVNHESSIQISRMKYLHLEGFPRLLTLPQWIEGAANTLHTLMIFNFPNLKMLPECLAAMTHLKRLHIFDCPQLSSFPSDMHCRTTLEHLMIGGCPELCRNVSHNLMNIGT